MRLADQPAVLQWPELKGAPWGQKNDPIQHQREFATLTAAANYGGRELSETVRKIAIIRVSGIPDLYWETWRAYSELAE